MTSCAILLLSAAVVGQVPDNVLLDFSASWCGPCRQMAPIVDKLARQGLPVRKIDVDANPGMTQRYRIKGIPAFVLIVNGKIVDRSVGYTSERKLRQMLSRIPAQIAKNRSRPQTGPPKPPVSKRSQDRNKGSNLRVADAASHPMPRFQLPVDAGERSQGTVIRGNLDEDKFPQSVNPMKASARIRVVDGNGINYGSGTVIDSRPGRSIVLTCAHIFRDISKQAVVEVDLFDGEESRTYQGKILSYNLEADVGLIAIATSDPIPSIPLIPASDALRKGAEVFGIGCGGGKRPVRLPMRVTALNRYLGPDNIECTVVPQQGRSGGGLFDTQGRLVGVCFAADPKSARGLYAGIRPIRQILQKAGVSLSSRTDEAALASNTSDEEPESPTERPRSVRIDQRQLALMQVNLTGRGRTSRSRTGDAESNPFPEPAKTQRRTIAVGSEKTETLHAIDKAFGKSGGAEVICIVRSLDNPRAASEVVIINRASPKFVQYLRNEVSTQPRKTSRSVRWQDQLSPAQLTATLQQESRKPSGQEKLVSPFRQVSETTSRKTPVRQSVPAEPGRYRRSARTRTR